MYSYGSPAHPVATLILRVNHAMADANPARQSRYDMSIEEVAVVDTKNPKRLVGTVHRQDVINARNQEVLRRDLAGSMSSTIRLVAKVRRVEVGDGYVVQEIPVPRSFVGRTLRELNFRARYGVQVIFVRTQRKEDGIPYLRIPTADDLVSEADALIIAGPKEAADKLEAL